MGRPMLWRLSFLAYFLSPAISGNSLQRLLSVGFRNSPTGLHVMQRRSAQISTDNTVDIDDKSTQLLSDVLEDNGKNDRNSQHFSKQQESKDRSVQLSASLVAPGVNNEFVDILALGSSDTKTLDLSEEARRYRTASRPSSLLGINHPNTNFNKGRPRHFSRIISSSEYIFPHQITGGQEVLYCTKLGELHYYWSEDYDCLVCVCLQDLTAVCASCGGCIKPQLLDQTFSPPPVPIPPPSSSLVPLRPTVPQSPTAKPFPDDICSPLSSNKPFQNPLNPCQTCICREQIDVYGKPNAQIDCHENSQCVLPPEPIPQIPEPLIPVPLPLCDKFPTDVLFPHPTNVCLTCKCVVVPSALLTVKHLSCSPNPECETVSPISLPIPVPERIPRPQPTIEPEPILPGPLPGPSPHESCRPYTPNQTFQHPWDECQLCVCTEGYATNQVIVEVNCFTKKSCCIEYAQSSKTLPLPYYPTGGSSIVDASSIANIQNSGGLMLYSPESSSQFEGSPSADAANALAFANSLQGGSITGSDAFAISNAGHNQYSAGYPGYISNSLAQGTGYSNIVQGVPYAETDALANLGQSYYVPFAQGGYPVQSIFPVQNTYSVADGGALINPGLKHNFYPSTRPKAGAIIGPTDANPYATDNYVKGYPDIISLNEPGLISPYQQQGQVISGFADATAHVKGQGQGTASAYMDTKQNSNQLDLFGNPLNKPLAAETSTSILNGGYYVPFSHAQSQANAYVQSQTMGQTSSKAFASSAIKSADPALQNSAESD